MIRRGTSSVWILAATLAFVDVCQTEAAKIPGITGNNLQEELGDPNSKTMKDIQAMLSGQNARQIALSTCSNYLYMDDRAIEDLDAKLLMAKDVTEVITIIKLRNAPPIFEKITEETAPDIARLIRLAYTCLRPKVNTAAASPSVPQPAQARSKIDQMRAILDMQDGNTDKCSSARDLVKQWGIDPAELEERWVEEVSSLLSPIQKVRRVKEKMPGGDINKDNVETVMSFLKLVAAKPSSSPSSAAPASSTSQGTPLEQVLDKLRVTREKYDSLLKIAKKTVRLTNHERVELRNFCTNIGLNSDDKVKAFTDQTDLAKAAKMLDSLAYLTRSVALFQVIPPLRSITKASIDNPPLTLMSKSEVVAALLQKPPAATAAATAAPQAGALPPTARLSDSDQERVDVTIAALIEEGNVLSQFQDEIFGSSSGTWQEKADKVIEVTSILVSKYNADINEWIPVFSDFFGNSVASNVSLVCLYMSLPQDVRGQLVWENKGFSPIAISLDAEDSEQFEIIIKRIEKDGFSVDDFKKYCFEKTSSQKVPMSLSVLNDVFVLMATISVNTRKAIEEILDETAARRVFRKSVFTEYFRLYGNRQTRLFEICNSGQWPAVDIRSWNLAVANARLPEDFSPDGLTDQKNAQKIADFAIQNMGVIPLILLVLCKNPNVTVPDVLGICDWEIDGINVLPEKMVSGSAKVLLQKGADASSEIAYGIELCSQNEKNPEIQKKIKDRITVIKNVATELGIAISPDN
ncbi:MAG: hypothetical protein LBG20_03090 [Holosporaceae bacterium]|jgi:hypothetical protein|nr:hypothetical protein [Holosporaceae bacterium]